MKWKEEEVEYLMEHYPNNTDNYLSKKLNKSLSSIRNKSRRLSLKKSKLHKSKMISKRNKMVGRDLTFDKLKEIALKYKTRGEFQLNDPSAYSSARISKCLDVICKHMINQSFSTPQLICKYIFDKLVGEECEYNTRKIIKPYELDLYYKNCKLAIEYNGKGWHTNENDNTDLKIKMCTESGIKLIVIIENNRRYEEDVKNQIIDNLSIINDVLNKKIKKEDILNIEINSSVFDGLLDDDYIFEITNRYYRYSDFMKNESSLYQKLRRIKQLDKYTSHMVKNTFRWDITKVKEVIIKYEYLQDFIDNDYGCYLYIKKNKLEQIIKHLKYKRNS